MTFDKIGEGHECGCLLETNIPKQEDIFIRKLRKQTLEEIDLATHTERGISPPSESCDDICGYNALSINKTSSETEQLIYEHYKITFKINPKKGNHCIKFSFKTGAGKVIHTPIDGADSHYNFFKSDLFNFDHIEIVEVIKYENETN